MNTFRPISLPLTSRLRPHINARSTCVLSVALALLIGDIIGSDKSFARTVTIGDTLKVEIVDNRMSDSDAERLYSYATDYLLQSDKAEDHRKAMKILDSIVTYSTGPVADDAMYERACLDVRDRKYDAAIERFMKIGYLFPSGNVTKEHMVDMELQRIVEGPLEWGIKWEYFLELLKLDYDPNGLVKKFMKTFTRATSGVGRGAPRYVWPYERTGLDVNLAVRCIAAIRYLDPTNKSLPAMEKKVRDILSNRCDIYVKLSADETIDLRRNYERRQKLEKQLEEETGRFVEWYYGVTVVQGGIDSADIARYLKKEPRS